MSEIATFRVLNYEFSKKENRLFLTWCGEDFPSVKWDEITSVEILVPGPVLILRMDEGHRSIQWIFEAKGATARQQDVLLRQPWSLVVLPLKKDGGFFVRRSQEDGGVAWEMPLLSAGPQSATSLKEE